MQNWFKIIHKILGGINCKNFKKGGSIELPEPPPKSATDCTPAVPIGCELSRHIHVHVHYKQSVDKKVEV